MAKSDFIPPRDNDFVAWHDTFNASLPGVATTFGLVAADVAAVAADNAALHAKLAAANTAAAAAQKATGEKTATRAAVEKNARALARSIKNHRAYTPATGALLRIEGPEAATDLSAAKPTLTGTDQTGGAVEVAFTKSTSDGVNLYARRDGDADFVFLARDTASPYVDNRPLLAAGKPEVRKYKAIYVVGDEETGLFSDEISVTAAP